MRCNHSLVRNQRQLAVSCLLLENGEKLYNQVVTFDENGKLLHFDTLHEELPFCTWYRGTWHETECLKNS